MRAAALALAAALAALAALPAAAPAAPASYASAPVALDGLRAPARVGGEAVELAVGGRFAPRFWPGVNLGATVPGAFPGEHAPTRRDFDRWLAGMDELGVRVVRVYTLLEPAFYDALAAHNRRRAARPIHLLQGVWIPEEEAHAAGDLHAVTAEWHAELRKAVAALHGDAVVPPRPGHASGRYRTSVARWLVGWSPGVEWDPGLVAATDARHAGEPPHAGRYVAATADATPTESWIAAGLDLVATLEAERGWTRPLTFTNWVTTDPLRHPLEPSEEEDAVSVDARHLAATAAWPGGMFASYHVYPYYPDFLSLEYASAPDPYAAYLRALRAHHAGQPLMVTEFGVPTSLGLAHRGPLGCDQGGHDERAAARVDASLLGAIRSEGLAGGIAFEWIDEWFKHTWNSQPFELPADRRSMWRNALTNEEHFGLVAAEPGRRPVAVLDGRGEEWARNRSRVVARSRSGPVREVRAVHDAAYVWLRVTLARPAAWRSAPVVLAFDVHPAAGGGLRDARGAVPGADVAIVAGPGERARVEQAAWLDPVPHAWPGDVPLTEAMAPGSGAWSAPRQIVSRRLRHPDGRVEEPVLVEHGELRWGARDTRALVAGRGRVLELRVPWALLSVSDPSSRRALDLRPGQPVGTRELGRVGIAAVAAGGAPVTGSYRWAGWQRVDWHERRKAGWATLRRAFASASVVP
jgi:hypothetical protein